MLTHERLLRLVASLVRQHLLDPAVLVGTTRAFVGRRSSYVSRLEYYIIQEVFLRVLG